MASLPKRKLLLVDDDLVLLNLLTNIFESDERLDVFCATTGEEAMQTAAEIGPDLVLLDISLHDREGHAVCRFIKYHPKCGRTKVVFLSGLADQAEWNTWKKVGADGFLIKPFEINDLLAAIGQYLGLSGPTALAS